MKHLPTLHLHLENEYKIVQTDASQTGWGGILLAVTNIGEEKLCRYCSGTFNDYQKNLSSTDFIWGKIKFGTLKINLNQWFSFLINILTVKSRFG